MGTLGYIVAPFIFIGVLGLTAACFFGVLIWTRLIKPFFDWLTRR